MKSSWKEASNIRKSKNILMGFIYSHFIFSMESMCSQVTPFRFQFKNQIRRVLFILIQLSLIRPKSIILSRFQAISVLYLYSHLNQNLFKNVLFEQILSCYLS